MVNTLVSQKFYNTYGFHIKLWDERQPHMKSILESQEELIPLSVSV